MLKQLNNNKKQKSTVKKCFFVCDITDEGVVPLIVRLLRCRRLANLLDKLDGVIFGMIAGDERHCIGGENSLDGVVHFEGSLVIVVLRKEKRGKKNSTALGVSDPVNLLLLDAYRHPRVYANLHDIHEEGPPIIR